MKRKIFKLLFSVFFAVAFFGSLSLAFDTKTYAANSVIKSTPIISEYPTASEIHVGQSLLKCNLSGGRANVPGKISWKYPTVVPNLGTNSCKAIFTPNDSTNYKSVEFSVNVNVTKWKIKISSLPVASSICLGQPLSESTLSGGTASTLASNGSKVDGKFSWQTPEFVPITVGTHSHTVVFIPTDSNRYESVTFNMHINVRNILIKTPKASDITFGEPLSKSALQDGWACVPGTFSWENPGLVLNAGTHTCTATFTPTDLTKFKKINFDVPVKVKQVSVTLYAFPQATPIVYGQKLSDSKIYNLYTNVPGVIDWKYNSEKNEILSVGTHYKWIVFTPTDSNYEPFPYRVKVKVYKAAPSLPKKTYFSATYKPNMRFKDFKLSGDWKWENPDALIDFTGTRKVKIYREETKNYLAAKDYVSINIAPADPELELGDIIYSENQHLYDIRLPKGWSWNDPQRIPTSDTEYYKATFNPDKSDNKFYHFDNNVSVKMKVKKATPIIKKWIEPSSDYIYGTDLSTIKKTRGEANVSGTFYLGKIKSDIKIGENEISIKFVPDNSNYLTVFASTYVNVVKNKTPEIPPENPHNKITKTDTSISFEKKYGIDELEYSADGGKTWQDSLEFNNLKANTTYKFIKRYKNTKFRCTGKNSPELILKTKLPSPKAPEKVTPVKKTDTKVILKSTANLEYSKDGGETWQDSPEFNNLKPNTTYNFVARIKATEESAASFISEKNIIKTKLSATNAPKKLELIKKTNHQIVFAGGPNQEYSMDGGKTWQDSPEFKDLSGSTTYNFVTRFKETEECMSSPISKEKTIKTLSWFKNVFWNKLVNGILGINISWEE